MATLTCQIVRPDKLLYEGQAEHIVLISHTGELGVWPGHASEICSLGAGVMRLTQPVEEGGGVLYYVTSGGYAEIDNDLVVILADHAREINDIDVETVERTRNKAQAAHDALDAEDHRRLYYENKIAWCDLLLKHAPTGDKKQTGE